MHPAGPPNDDRRPAINSIFDFSAEALGQLRTWLEQNPPAVSISQILGFSQFTATPATPILTQETTASGTYVNLATTGPSITGLSPGKYLVIFGCEAFNATAGNGCRMSFSPNGAAAVDNDEAMTASGVLTGTMRIATATLSTANSSLVAKYRGDAATVATFGRRWMVALKYAND